MITSQSDEEARPLFVRFAGDDLFVDLSDGRSIKTPLSWYPRLVAASEKERNAWELSASGVHWPDIDEDLSISGMLAGRRALGKSGPKVEIRVLDKLISLKDYRDQKKRFAIGNLLVDVEPSKVRELIERAQNEG